VAVFAPNPPKIFLYMVDSLRLIHPTKLLLFIHA